MCHNSSCPFYEHNEKSTNGCPCTELCPGFIADSEITYSNRTEQTNDGFLKIE